MCTVVLSNGDILNCQDTVANVVALVNSSEVKLVQLLTGDGLMWINTEQVVKIY